MEDPVGFDVWGTVRPGAWVAALEALRRRNPRWSELRLRRVVARGVAEKKPIRIVDGLGWAAATSARVELDGPFTHVLVLQEGYEAAGLPGMQFCESHRFYFGGVLGCHVCRGWARL